MSRLNLGADNLIIDSDYSTEEKETGATWIDGKPIYRKSYRTTNITKSANERKDVYFDRPSNFGTLVGVFGGANILFSGNTYWYPIPVSMESSDVSWFEAYFQVRNVADNTGLTITGSAAMTIYEAVVTILYTKTTD